VLDQLNLSEAVFVGHSVAGTEMNEIAAAYPDRVQKLVFLDALDLGSNGWAALPQPPPPPAETEAELDSVQRLAAAEVRRYGHRKPLAAVCHSVRRDPSGRVVGALTPPEVSQKIVQGIRPADYGRIQAPVLGIFNAIKPSERLPYYWSLDPAAQQEFARRIEPLASWMTGAIRRFRGEVEGARVVELEDTSHYLFLVEEAVVVREMRRFLLGE
jgi:non-heme chloroperoxidase